MKTYFIITLFVLIPINVFSETIHMHRSLGSHVHGAGNLNVVMEDTILKVYLDAPSSNILGFEHEPTTPAEHTQLDDVLKKLQNSKNILILSGGECHVSDSKISHPFDDVHKMESDEHVHSDIGVEYTFVCQKPLELKTVNLSLFNSFNGFERLHVQWIVDSMSGVGEFDHEQHVLKVR